MLKLELEEIVYGGVLSAFELREFKLFEDEPIAPPEELETVGTICCNVTVLLLVLKFIIVMGVSNFNLHYQNLKDND